MPNKVDDRAPAQQLQRMKRNAPMTPRKGRYGIQKPVEPGWQRSYRLDSENLGRNAYPGMPQVWDNNDPSLKYQKHDIGAQRTLAEEPEPMPIAARNYPQVMPPVRDLPPGYGKQPPSPAEVEAQRKRLKQYDEQIRRMQRQAPKAKGNPLL